MIIAVVGVVILALMLAVVVAIAKDRGPGPGDAAVAYELAWDRLDFESLYTLSGTELRDGLDRHGFVAAKRAAYEQQHQLGGLVDGVGVDEAVSVGDAAVVITSVELRDGTVRAQPGGAGPAQRARGRWWRTGSSRRPRTRPAPAAEPVPPTRHPCWVISDVERAAPELDPDAPLGLAVREADLDPARPVVVHLRAVAGCRAARRQ